MNFKITVKVIMLLLVFCLSMVGAEGQNSSQKVTRQTAINAFSQRKFDVAYSQFNELLTTYPGDPVYKYYCGACLVETGREPVKASGLLNEAAHESGAIRSVPPDCFFYLGRALQMSGKFKDAIDAYNRFTGQAGKKSSKEMNVPEFIKQCGDQKGKLQEGSEDEQVNQVKDSTALNKSASGRDEDSIKKTPALKTKPDTLPADYEKLLALTLETRIKADSLSGILEKNGNPPVTKTDSAILKKREGPAKDENVIAVNQRDTTSHVIKPVLKGTAVFSEFTVDDKPVYKPDEKAAVDPDVPAGLIYRIQVAVFRNPVAPPFFKGMKPVQGFRNKSNGITTYYAGRFRRLTDAGQPLLKVRSLGFRDAFVVALMDKKPVSTERAAGLEKEWGLKPLFTTAPVEDKARDTVPPTLVFRVEVKRSQKPLPDDQVEAIKKIAGNRGFDIETPGPKQYIYLIGKFLTFNSATEFTDLLIRNGFKDAKVAAWLGKREIPVETAKQLFDQQ